MESSGIVAVLHYHFTDHVKVQMQISSILYILVCSFERSRGQMHKPGAQNPSICHFTCKLFILQYIGWEGGKRTRDSSELRGGWHKEEISIHIDLCCEQILACMIFMSLIKHFVNRCYLHNHIYTLHSFFCFFAFYNRFISACYSHYMFVVVFLDVCLKLYVGILILMMEKSLLALIR